MQEAHCLGGDSRTNGYHCQPWWGQGSKCSGLLSKIKLNLLNYASHDITQDRYHETAISPMGDNCLLFGLGLFLVLNSGLKN